MKKFILLLLALFVFVPNCFAEKIPVKFTPVQQISTHHDEVEVGDWIKFKVINDVYVDNKLYIKANTPIIGVVSHVHENGLTGDSAEIIIEKFMTKTVSNTKITIPYTLKLSRKDYLTPKFGDKIVKYIGVAFKGNEIKIEPESIKYNLFLNK